MALRRRGLARHAPAVPMLVLVHVDPVQVLQNFGSERRRLTGQIYLHNRATLFKGDLTLSQHLS